jgi:hypothetical protein
VVPVSASLLQKSASISLDHIPACARHGGLAHILLRSRSAQVQARSTRRAAAPRLEAVLAGRRGTRKLST